MSGGTFLQPPRRAEWGRETRLLVSLLEDAISNPAQMKNEPEVIVHEKGIGTARELRVARHLEQRAHNNFP